MLNEHIASSEQRIEATKLPLKGVRCDSTERAATHDDERRATGTSVNSVQKRRIVIWHDLCKRGCWKEDGAMNVLTIAKKNRGGLAEREWMKVRWEWEDDDDAMSVDAAAQINWCKTSYLLYSTSTVYNRSVCARTCLTSKTKLKKAWMYDF